MALRLKPDPNDETRVRAIVQQTTADIGAPFDALSPAQKQTIREWLARAAFLGLRDERQRWAFRAYNYERLDVRIGELETMRDGLLAQMRQAAQTFVEDDGT